MTDVLYIAAKAPRPGFAKTRLSRTLGEAPTLRLYEGFLRDLAERFAAAPFSTGWYITPPHAWPELAPFAGPLGQGAGVLAQGPGDWTARQDALFAGAVERGEERTILIGADSPHLAVDVVSRAFALLREHEIVLGPALDGGYYLIGMRGYHDVLRGTTMSTGAEMREIADCARSGGVRAAELPPTFDVDVESDLHHLRDVAEARADLAHTYRALRAIEEDRVGTEAWLRYLPESGQAGAGSDAANGRRDQRR